MLCRDLPGAIQRSPKPASPDTGRMPTQAGLSKGAPARPLASPVHSDKGVVRRQRNRAPKVNLLEFASRGVRNNGESMISV